MIMAEKYRMACGTYRSNRGCSNARKLDYGKVEARVIDGLRQELLAPDAIEAFVDEFRKELELGRADYQRIMRTAAGERTKVEAKIARLVDAIADGVDSPAMRAELLKFEAKMVDLDADAVEIVEAENVIELLPNLPDLYRRKIAELDQVLAGDELMRRQAAGVLRMLIDKIVAKPEPGRGQWSLTLHSRAQTLNNLAVRPEHDGNCDHVWGLVMASPGGLEPPFPA